METEKTKYLGEFNKIVIGMPPIDSEEWVAQGEAIAHNLKYISDLDQSRLN